MKLYHGTSSRYKKAILENGILPRELTRRKSLWSGKVESRKNLVYLSDAYPVYYAYHAANNANLLLLEVEIEEQFLYPDEDFLGYLLSRQEGIDLIEATYQMEPINFQEHYVNSLKFNGTASCLKVEPEWITRHVVIPYNEIGLILQSGGDAAPVPINYMIFQEYYRYAVRLLFENDSIENLKQQLKEKWQTTIYNPGAK